MGPASRGGAASRETSRAGRAEPPRAQRAGDAEKGSTRYRVRPNGQHDGSENVIRTLLQQLDDAGYINTNEKRGRELTGEGRTLLDETATRLIEEELDRPELERYA